MSETPVPEAIYSGERTEAAIKSILEGEFADFIFESPYPTDGNDSQQSLWRNQSYYPRMIESVGSRLSALTVGPDLQQEESDQASLTERLASMVKVSHRDVGVRAKDLVNSGRSVVSKIIWEDDAKNLQSALAVIWDFNKPNKKKGRVEATLTTARIGFLPMSTGSPHGGRLVQYIEHQRVPIRGKFRFGVGQELDFGEMSGQKKIPKSAIVGAGAVLTIAGAGVIYVTHQLRKQ